MQLLPLSLTLSWCLPAWVKRVMTAGMVTGLALGGLPSFTWASGVVTNCTESALLSALSGGGTVLVACDGTIALSSTLLIAKDTILDATGRSAGISGGQNTNMIHLFLVQPGARLTLRNLTISGGRFIGVNGANGTDGETAFGAAIFNDGGIVDLDNCTVENHLATGGGGANAVQAGRGGGDGGLASGAAIYNNTGELYVTNTVFSGNVATGGAGAIGGAGQTGIKGGSPGEGGSGGTAAGAAIYNTGHGSVVVLDSLFLSNRVVGSSGEIGGPPGGRLNFPGSPGEPGMALGSAVCNQSGTMVIVNSTFQGNRGTGAAGLPGYNGDQYQAQDGQGGGPALGAIFNSGTLALTNCTFVGNTLVGGAGGAGGTGSTLRFGSDGADGGRGGHARGAGLYTGPGGQTEIVNCSFSENSTLAAAGGAGGPGSGVGNTGDEGDRGDASGAAVYNGGGVVHLRNSILAHSTSGDNAAGSIADAGFNLSSDATPLLTAAGSHNSIDPLLGILSAGTGRVPVLTLSSNSPAVDAIFVEDGNGCPPFDQRNAVRAGICDIGAFELGAGPATPTLQAQRSNGRVLLTWPDGGQLVLQSSGDLGSPGHWRIVTNSPSSGSGTQTLSLPSTNSAQFFHLMAQ